MTRKLPAPRQLAVTAVGGSLIFASVLLAPFAAGAPPCDRGDADGDGMSNLAECNFGTNPEEADSDHDNVSDPDEVHKYNTDPWKPDTDDDAISDWLEITGGTNPNVNDNAPGQGPGQGPDQVEECPGGAPDDCDADGMLNEDEINGWNSTGTPTDPKDPDSDNDDVNDGAEDDNGTNPQDPNDK